MKQLHKFKKRLFIVIVSLVFISSTSLAQDIYYPKIATGNTTKEWIKEAMVKLYKVKYKEKLYKIEDVDFFEDSICIHTKNNVILIIDEKEKRNISVSFNNTLNRYDAYLKIEDLILTSGYHQSSGLNDETYTIATHLADCLYSLQIRMNNRMNNEVFENMLQKFKKEAEQYMTSGQKSSLSEEQRRLIVQANAANEEKEYISALRLYEKAMKINIFSYPQAYNNMALLAAQINDFAYAIFNIKKYLLLVPDAPDARAAQDKIYEWEYKLNN